MFNTKSLIGRILYVVAAWFSDSKYHVRETLPRFGESYQSASKNGDLKVVGYCDGSARSGKDQDDKTKPNS